MFELSVSTCSGLTGDDPSIRPVRQRTDIALDLTGWRLAILFSHRTPLFVHAQKEFTPPVRDR